MTPKEPYSRPLILVTYFVTLVFQLDSLSDGIYPIIQLQSYMDFGSVDHFHNITTKLTHSMLQSPSCSCYKIIREFKNFKFLFRVRINFKNNINSKIIKGEKIVWTHWTCPFRLFDELSQKF